MASTALVRSVGLKKGRCRIGATTSVIAAVATVAVVFTGQWLWALVLLSVVYGSISFQQPTMFAACLDIGGEHAGATTGAMNSAAQAGSFVSSVAFGYLLGHYGSYDLPFFPMAALLLFGAWLWLQVDPTVGISQSVVK
jgi:predicted MFS family arabinose efflux permease